jgi:hypothetical protein
MQSENDIRGEEEEQLLDLEQMQECIAEAEGLEETIEENMNDDNVNDTSMMEDTVVMVNGNQRQQSQQRYNLRSDRKRDYSYRFAMLSLKAGLKHWDQKAKEAMMDEFKLCLSEEVFEVLKNPT